MFGKFRSHLFALLVAGFAASASAGFIDDTVLLDVYIGHYGSHSYSHELGVYGVGPTGTETLLNGQLEIFFSDDNDDFCSNGFCPASSFPDEPESVLIIVENVAFGPSEDPINLGSFMLGSIAAEALLEVNQTGELDVTVFSTMGDFILDSSVFKGDTASKVSVPEPGVLALLGLGLVGLRLARPRA